jgi:hypothetical protein
MLLTTLTTLESAIRAAWSIETTDPASVETWSPESPAWGQCAVTALVVHDYLGGEILHAPVTRGDGSDGGHHYWNRLAGGIELDLTLEQFQDGQQFGPVDIIVLPPDTGAGRLADQTARMRGAVARQLPTR